MKRVRFTSKVIGWCEVKYTKQVYTYNYDYVGFQFFLLGTISVNQLFNGTLHYFSNLLLFLSHHCMLHTALLFYYYYD